MECYRSYDLISIMCHLASSILAQRCGLSNSIPPNVPLAQEIPHKKMVFQVGQCVLKADICEWCNHAPTLRSCKNIDTHFPPWGSA